MVFRSGEIALTCRLKNNLQQQCKSSQILKENRGFGNAEFNISRIKYRIDIFQPKKITKWHPLKVNDDWEGHEGYELTCKAEVKESWYGRGMQELFISARDFGLSVERRLL